MLTMSSKALSAGQARTYHAREFASEQANYWSRDQQGFSEWQGSLAEQWGISGSVDNEHFARLSEGQHPTTEAQLVRHQVSRTYDDKGGKEVTSVEHRAGWDATFSAPKSVSLTALVGGDERVREAHRENVRVALGEIEHYTQARIGNVHAPETTGKFAAATFEHDTARPVDGYAAPQLHTHAVIFNVTERENGQTRSVQSHELYASQHYGTAIYRAELATRLQKLGYELERGKDGQPEIKGYTREYLEASSPRRQQVQDYKREQGIDGAAAGQIAAHRTRDKKELQTPAEVQRQHRELAGQYGHQADRVVAEMRERTQKLTQEKSPAQSSDHTRTPEQTARQAVTYARDHLFEKDAVQDRKALYETALNRGMGEITYSNVRQEFEHRMQAGEFRQAPADGRYWLLSVGAQQPDRWEFSPYYFLVIGVTAVLCWLAAVFIVMPVRKITAAVVRFGQGDLSARTNLRRKDEVGQLAGSFNDMAERLERLLVSEKRLLQDISHELRSPLTRLKLAIKLARTSSDPTSALDRIDREVNRITMLTSEIVEVTRLEGDPQLLKLSSVNLAEMVQEAIDACCAEVECRPPSMRVDVQFSGSVRCDRELLLRAVENILRNAVRYSPRQGPINIVIRRETRTVMLSVRDFGPGVPDESLSQLFEPFFRVDEARDEGTGGVGLGLSIAKRAVHLHKGTVEAHNADPGLRVEIVLPL